MFAATDPALADHPPRRDVVERQLRDHMRLAPGAALGNIATAMIAAGAQWQERATLAEVGWALLVVAVNVIRLRHWRRHADGQPLHDPEQTARTVETMAAVNGAVWGAGFILFALIDDMIHVPLLGMLIGGMIGAASISYGPMPRAATAFVSTAATGGAAACIIAGGPIARPALLLCLCYALVLARGAQATGRTFAQKVASDLALRESAETVQLLLSDFVSQSRDWLWRTDASGRIVDVGERFAAVAGRAATAMEQQSFLGLFDDTPERATLAICLAEKRAFRALTLCLTIDGTVHWWSLSARAAKDGGMRGVATDVTAAKLTEAHMARMAHYDSLTNLANRSLFNASMEAALARADDDHHVAILYIDLDHFKAVNDTLGHPIGDRLLCEVARRVEGACDRGDLVARLGGDEFAVLVEAVGADDRRLVERADRIVTAIARPYEFDGHRVLSSASIGITLANQDDSAAEMLRRADLALYAAKDSGRNRHIHFEPAMDEAARQRRRLEMDLRQALRLDQFELHYQPMVDIAVGRTVGYEALLRWDHPDRGVVMPDTFLTIAEESGLLVQMGEWVIRQAVEQAAAWPDAVVVSVNLSAAQMRNANLTTHIVNVLARAGIAPGRLELEVTESVLGNDTPTVLATLHKLRTLGVRIALDDFGKGSSSLNRLRSFPFDKIKLDRAFIGTIDSSEDCRAVVRAVTGLAGSLGMVTVAEGVERREQLDALRRLGCDQAQGYFFSRPERAGELSDLRRRPARNDDDLFGPVDPAAFSADRRSA